MITVTIEQKLGTVTRKIKVSAASIERALEIAGATNPKIDTRVVFPIDGETFFAASSAEGIDFGSMTTREIRAAIDAGGTCKADEYDRWMQRLMDEMDRLESAREAHVEALKHDLGAEAFEVHAVDNGIA